MHAYAFVYARRRIKRTAKLTVRTVRYRRPNPIRPDPFRTFVGLSPSRGFWPRPGIRTKVPEPLRCVIFSLITNLIFYCHFALAALLPPTPTMFCLHTEPLLCGMYRVAALYRVALTWIWAAARADGTRCSSFSCDSLSEACPTSTDHLPTIGVCCSRVPFWVPRACFGVHFYAASPRAGAPPTHPPSVWCRIVIIGRSPGPVLHVKLPSSYLHFESSAILPALFAFHFSPP